MNTLSFKQATSCSRYSIITLFNGADIKVEVTNFCAAMDTLINQDVTLYISKISKTYDTILETFTVKLKCKFTYQNLLSPDNSSFYICEDKSLNMQRLTRM